MKATFLFAYCCTNKQEAGDYFHYDFSLLRKYFNLSEKEIIELVEQPSKYFIAFRYELISGQKKDGHLLTTTEISYFHCLN